MRVLLENTTFLLHTRIAGIIRVAGIIRGRALYEEVRYRGAMDGDQCSGALMTINVPLVSIRCPHIKLGSQTV